MLLLFLINLYLPLDDWTYPYVDELRVRGEVPVLFMNTTPYEQERFLENLREINEVTQDRQIWSLSNKLLKALDHEGFSLKPSFLLDTTSRGFGFIDAKGKIKNFSSEIEFGLKIGNSDEYPPLAWKGESVAIKLGVDTKKGYGAYRNGGFELLLGRMPFKWGVYPGPSLLISGTSPSFNMLMASFEYKKFKGSFFFSVLDPYTQDTGKYLAAHRIDFSLFHDKLLLGLSEAVLFCRKNPFSGLAYLNPFSIYRITAYTYEFNDSMLGIPVFNDNLFWDLDFAWFNNNKSVYGEILLDDLKTMFTDIKSMLFLRDVIESGPFGVMWGFKWVDFPLRRTYSVIQYTRVNSYTYFHYYRHNYFINTIYPIGHPAGSDFDQILYSLTYHHNEKMDYYFNFSFMRHGKARVRYDAPVPPRNSFLWGKDEGLVENSITPTIGVSLFFLPRLTIKGEAGFSWIKNYQNQKNINKTNPIARLYLNFQL
jgi:Capsule assembly protein Wzi